MEIKIEIVANERDGGRLNYLAAMFSALGGQVRELATLEPNEPGATGAEQDTTPVTPPAAPAEPAEPQKTTRHRKTKAELEAEAAAKTAKEEDAAIDNGEDKTPDAPVEKEASAVTEVQVRAALVAVAKAGKQPEMKALLTSFGVQKLSDLKPDQYAAAKAAAEKLVS